MHISNTEIFNISLSCKLYTGTGDWNLCSSIRKLMSVVVKDVDLEAMPTSIFLNDDDDEFIVIGLKQIHNHSSLASTTTHSARNLG